MRKICLIIGAVLMASACGDASDQEPAASSADSSREAFASIIRSKLLDDCNDGRYSSGGGFVSVGEDYYDHRGAHVAVAAAALQEWRNALRAHPEYVVNSELLNHYRADELLKEEYRYADFAEAYTRLQEDDELHVRVTSRRLPQEMYGGAGLRIVSCFWRPTSVEVLDIGIDENGQYADVLYQPRFEPSDVMYFLLDMQFSSADYSAMSGRTPFGVDSPPRENERRARLRHLDATGWRVEDRF